MIGTTLSHYKIIEKLGQGGMGEVYLAEDSRLDRKVALKILPQHLAERAELRERFEREARAVSGLNHPHICTLYDIGEQDGIHYLVMEHLVGETLEARLAKGPLPLEQTLEYAIQIADALDKAHRQGVVHRDLKPGNIMLVKSGAKLLDFGLAKLQAAETPTNLSALPTEQANLTAEGTILGTLQYMAPEQLEAKEADSRTDIFAFGAVVFEMATGKKAFEGKSQASLIAAIMGKDPPLMSELQSMTPQLLDWVVKRCLEKEPDERVQSASDLMAELRLVSEVRTPVDSLPGVTGPATWKRAVPWSLVALMILITSVAIWSPWRTSSVPMTATFTINLPAGDNLILGAGPTSAISHDGRHLVYVADRDGQEQIYHRALDKAEAIPLGDTVGARRLFFSPDDQWVGFQAKGKLMKIPLTGGAPFPIADADTADVVGASWGSDGNIILGGSVGSGLSIVPDTGGIPETITTPDLENGESSHLWPQILPGGHAVLFTIRTTASHDDARIGVLSLDSGEWQTVWQGGVYARYSTTGHLLYVRSGTLMAVPFSLTNLEVSGDPIPVLSNVLVNQGSGASNFALSSDGTMVFLQGTGNDAGDETLFLANRQGERERLATKRKLRYLTFSPDGKSLAVTVSENSGFEELDTWIYDFSRATFSPLAFEGNTAYSIWTPNGKELTFTTSFEGGNIFQVPLGGGVAKQITTGESSKRPGSWSPDGKSLAFQEGSSGNWDIRVLALESGKDSQPFLVNPFDERDPRFSPSGGWIAFTSNRSGQDEIYAKPYGREGGVVRVSTEGGAMPGWAANGKELFYLTGNKIMAVGIQGEQDLNVGLPKVLFEVEDNIGVFDVSPDGQQFALIRKDVAISTLIHITLNWFEELKRLAPTDN
ncbi:MAG: serine/threonine-protein kinase [Acidobacteria bacterium]|nr:MAG: serine/threonine-protein kinase [Acidobacteriota bacterium]